MLKALLKLPWTNRRLMMFSVKRNAGLLHHSPLRPRGSSCGRCWRWRPGWRSSSRRKGPCGRRWWPSWWRWSTCLRRSRRSCSRHSYRRLRRPTRRCCLCLHVPKHITTIVMQAKGNTLSRNVWGFFSGTFLCVCCQWCQINAGPANQSRCSRMEAAAEIKMTLPSHRSG